MSCIQVRLCLLIFYTAITLACRSYSHFTSGASDQAPWEKRGSIRGARCEVAVSASYHNFFSPQELGTTVASLRDVSHYYFDGQGKNIRPMIVQLMAGACNHHTCEIRYVHSNKISFRFGPVTMTCFVSLSRECSESWFLKKLSQY